jgi:hypothetical protein
MAARAGGEVRRRFNVVNRLRGRNRHSPLKAEMFVKEDFISGILPLLQNLIIFANINGADNIAKGEAGYGATVMSQEVLLEPVAGLHLDGERQSAGASYQSVMK